MAAARANTLRTSTKSADKTVFYATARQV